MLGVMNTISPSLTDSYIVPSVGAPLMDRIHFVVDSDLSMDHRPVLEGDFGAIALATTRKINGFLLLLERGTAKQPPLDSLTRPDSTG